MILMAIQLVMRKADVLLEPEVEVEPEQQLVHLGEQLGDSPAPPSLLNTEKSQTIGKKTERIVVRCQRQTTNLAS